MANRPQYLIVHTAAFKGDISESTIDSWHRDRGFFEGGYHYFINYDGLVEKGREENEIGAHCKDMGMNSKSLGICLEGHGDLEPWTPDQTDAFKRLAVDAMQRYKMPSSKVLGHRETGAKKTCPGKLIDMDQVRLMLALTMGAPAPVKITSKPLSRL